ncbi:MAG: antibiotic biosynthesis monooxygenase [Alphaproteobacteria bacterium]|nr:antibiotic biosynthesis monooxygenase [Alphaproteobacteria bacterium]
MFVVTVKFTLAAGAAEAFMPLMQAQAKNSVALEPGCHQFDVCQDPEDAAIVFLYELYSDEAAFKGHLASDHFKQFDADVIDLVTAKQVACYHRSYPS